mgnify:CR=1 FL=1
MRTTLSKKIKGGKLLRIDVGYGKEITSLKITGDFFLHPEETIKEIEKTCIGKSLPLEKSLKSELKQVMKRNNAELVGLKIKDIYNLLKEATE